MDSNIHQGDGGVWWWGIRRTYHGHSSWIFAPQRLTLQELKPTQVIIRVVAVGLNARDVSYHVREQSAPPRGMVPCSDAAGEVFEVGSAVRGLQKGSAVCTLPIQDRFGEERESPYYDCRFLGTGIDGVLTSYVVIDQEEGCVPIPRNLDWDEACCLPTAGLIAWNALNLNYTTDLSGCHILLNGVNDITMMALQFAIHAGARTMVVCSNEAQGNEFSSWLSQLHPAMKDRIFIIDREGNPRWDKAALHWAAGRGADLILHHCELDADEQMVWALRYGGIVHFVGDRDADTTTIGINDRLRDRNASCKFVGVGNRDHFTAMNNFIEQNNIRFKHTIRRKFKLTNDQSPGFKETEDFFTEFGKENAATNGGNIVIDVADPTPSFSFIPLHPQGGPHAIANRSTLHAQTFAWTTGPGTQPQSFQGHRQAGSPNVVTRQQGRQLRSDRTNDRLGPRSMTGQNLSKVRSCSAI